MTRNQTQERPIVTVTDQAALVLKAACEQMDPPASVVHFGMVPQGDSVSYQLRLTTEPAPSDVVFEANDLTLAVAEGQIDAIQGTELDYVPDGEQGSFVVTNPNG